MPHGWVSEPPAGSAFDREPGTDLKARSPDAIDTSPRLYSSDPWTLNPRRANGLGRAAHGYAHFGSQADVVKELSAG